MDETTVCDIECFLFMKIENKQHVIILVWESLGIFEIMNNEQLDYLFRNMMLDDCTDFKEFLKLCTTKRLDLENLYTNPGEWFEVILLVGGILRKFHAFHYPIGKSVITAGQNKRLFSDSDRQTNYMKNLNEYEANGAVIVVTKSKNEKIPGNEKTLIFSMSVLEDIRNNKRIFTKTFAPNIICAEILMTLCKDGNLHFLLYYVDQDRCDIFMSDESEFVNCFTCRHDIAISNELLAKVNDAKLKFLKSRSLIFWPDDGFARALKNRHAYTVDGTIPVEKRREIANNHNDTVSFVLTFGAPNSPQAKENALAIAKQEIRQRNCTIKPSSSSSSSSSSCSRIAAPSNSISKAGNKSTITSSTSKTTSSSSTSSLTSTKSTYQTRQQLLDKVQEMQKKLESKAVTTKGAVVQLEEITKLKAVKTNNEDVINLKDVLFQLENARALLVIEQSKKNNSVPFTNIDELEEVVVAKKKQKLQEISLETQRMKIQEEKLQMTHNNLQFENAREELNRKFNDSNRRNEIDEFERQTRHRREDEDRKRRHDESVNNDQESNKDKDMKRKIMLIEAETSAKTLLIAASQNLGTMQTLLQPNKRVRNDNNSEYSTNKLQTNLNHNPATIVNNSSHESCDGDAEERIREQIAIYEAQLKECPEE